MISTQSDQFYRQALRDVLDALEAIPYTHIDGYPFILRGEALETVRALIDPSHPQRGE